MRAVQIAIDGPSGAGKSTIAKILSEKLNIAYLDTGAMYRAVALKAIQNGIDTRDIEGVLGLLDELDIKIAFEEGLQKIILDGVDVSSLIRTDDVSMGASNVSAIPTVRKRLVELQQDIAENSSVVMDGRDIGTHVLPNADVKIFLTASANVRAQRRFKELKEKGLLTKSFEQLEKEIKIRDYNDSHREASPLIQAEDAVLLDTSDLDSLQVVERLLEIMRIKGIIDVL